MSVTASRRGIVKYTIEPVFICGQFFPSRRSTLLNADLELQMFEDEAAAIASFGLPQA